MQRYEIFIEEAENIDILEKNYMDLLLSIIISSGSEVYRDEHSDDIS